MFNKIILFSHNDLDGYACNVVCRTVSYLLESRGFNIPVESHNCDYSSIDSVILDRFSKLLDCEKEDTLFVVSDISWKSYQVTEIFKNTNYFLFADHHKTSEALAMEMVKLDTLGRRYSLSIEGRHCGAARLLECLDRLCLENNCNLGYSGKSEDVLDRLEDFVEIVEQWDLWLWANDPKVKGIKSALNLLNQLPAKLNAFLDFYSQSATGKDTHKFLDIIVNMIIHPVEKDLKTDLSRLMSDTDKFTEYISRQAVLISTSCRQYRRVPLPMPDGPDVETLCFSVPVGLKQKSIVSMLADNISSGIGDFDCIMIYETDSDTVSLRYPRNGMDLSHVAKSNLAAKDSTGGGHPCAAGFPVDRVSFGESLSRKRLHTI